MIIAFNRNNTFVNFDSVEAMCGKQNGDGNYFIEFDFKPGERGYYMHTFWEKENYDVAMSKIRDAFKKRKRYIEIDG